MDPIIRDMIQAAPTRPLLTEDEKDIVRLWVERASEDRRFTKRLEMARRKADQ